MYEAFLRRKEANRVTLSSGVSVGLPLRCLDWTGIISHFPAPLAGVRNLLPSRKLRPVEISPGTAILSLAAIEYRRLGDISPYNEVAIMTPVLHKPLLNIPALPFLFPGWFRSAGFFVYQMPVTTQEACELGEMVWGYPTVVADIAFEEIDDVRRCRLCVGGEDVLTLDVEQGPAKIRRIDYRVYTIKEDRLLRHTIQTEGLYYLSLLSGHASFTLGDHPIAEELRRLGVGTRAISRVFAGNASSLLYEADKRSPM